MIDSFINILSEITLPLFLLGIVFFMLFFFWNKLFTIFNLKTYHAAQRVHEDEIFRLSGFIIYLFFTILSFFDYVGSSFVSNLLVALIPLIIIGIKEDLLHNTSPKSRLFSMFMSCLIFFYINPIALPVIDAPFLGAIINFYPISIIFFTFSIMVVMNGMNLIDGMNGLLGFTALFLLLAISIIAFNVDDLFIMEIAIFFASPLIIFVIFNFPFGKVFMGDLGAYIYGFVISVLIIYLFGKHDHLLSWSAVLILFYPCMELLFSFVRKINNRMSPFDPDTKHLHSLIYKQIKIGCRNLSLANSLTTLSLFIFWLGPFFISLFMPIHFIINTGLILLMLICYIYLYRFVNVEFKD